MSQPISHDALLVRREIQRLNSILNEQGCIAKFPILPPPPWRRGLGGGDENIIIIVFEKTLKCKLLLLTFK